MKDSSKFVTLSLDKLVALFVASLQLEDGYTAKRHRYWYDQEKGEIVIQILAQSSDGQDDDDGEGGITTLHRKPLR